MGAYKIVLTGGPGGGKTTILNNIKKRLEDLEYQVFVVPETARDFIENGLKPNPENKEYTLQYQDSILKEQLLREKITEQFADAQFNLKKTVILYDRATLDNRAYLDTQEDFEEILQNNNVCELQLIDKYDLVIDLISLAATNKSAYVNDRARTESPEQAKQLDSKTTNAWLLHPNLKIVLPTEDIQEKEEIVMGHIFELLEDRKDFVNTTKKLTNYQKDKLLEKLTDKETKTINISTYRIATHSFKSREYWLTMRMHNYEYSYVLEMFFNDFGCIYCYERKVLTREEFNDLLEKYAIIERKERTETIFMKKFEKNRLCVEDKKAEMIIEPVQNLQELENAKSKKIVKMSNIW